MLGEGTLLDLPESRLALLARLRHGAGVVVLTGPEAAPFWGLCSLEVKVRIVPDDDEYTERFDSEPEWAYRSVGLSTTETGQLLRRKTPVPSDHRLYHSWMRAQQLLTDLGAVGEREPLIVEEYPTRQLTVEEGFDLLVRNTDPIALDWEWDTETTEPTGLAYGGPDWAGYLPIRAADIPQGPAGLAEAFSAYLLADRPAIMHGGRADLGTQFKGDPLDLNPEHIDDTMVMAYLCGEPILALKDLARKYLNRDPVDFPGNLSDLPAALGTRYASADARNTYDLYGILARTLVDRNQWGVYQRIEKPVIPIVVSMEREGIPVDLSVVRQLYLDTVKIEMGVRYAILDHYRLDVAQDKGKTLEDNQARQFVARVRGVDPGTLDQRVLTTFPEGEIDLLLLHRRSRTLRRNFLGRALRYHYAATHPGHLNHLFKAKQRFTKKGELTDLGEYLEWYRRWKELGDTSAFRYFPRYNQAGSMDGANRMAPRSGRFSSAGPNIQQQPRTMRDIFVPPKDCLWWSFDYSGLELHIAAALSQDPTMLRVLSEVCPDQQCTHKPKHGDLHSVLQYKVLELTGTLMDRAGVIKPANFEQLYGGGAGKLVELIAKGRQYITLDTAKSVVEGHKVTFPGYWMWADTRHEFHKRYGYGETLAGRRRYEPEVNSRDPERIAYALRALLNTEIQGSAADIVKIAMDRSVPVLKQFKAHMASQVHDELDGWTAPNPSRQYQEDFKSAMEEVLTGVELPGLKLKVEGGYGTSWGTAH